MKEVNDDFLFGGGGYDDESNSVFDKKTRNQDGIYRPKLTEAKDKKIGYKARIRFLPNLTRTEDGKILKGQNALEKHVHYVKLPNEPNLFGYYDCETNFEGTKCDLCTLYWKLDKSKNAADKEKAKLISKSTKFYSYIMVIEDEQHPELVGKLMIFPYSYQIKEKINSERTGEITNLECDPFDLVSGKDFRLIIKENAGAGDNVERTSYTSSSFLESSPVRLYNEEKKVFQTPPMENGKITNPKAIAKIKEFIFARTKNLEDHAAVKWTDEIRNKVYQILSIVSGEDFVIAEEKTNQAKTDATKNSASSPISKVNSTTQDDFFSLED